MDIQCLQFFSSRDMFIYTLLPYLSIFDVIHLFQSARLFRDTYIRVFFLDNAFILSKHFFHQRLKSYLAQLHGQENALVLFESIENGTLEVNGIFLLAVLNGDQIDERITTTFYCAIPKVAQVDIGYLREWVDKALLQQLPELILDKDYLKSKSVCAKSKKGNELFFHFDSLCFPNKTLYAYGILKLENKSSIREKSFIFDLYKTTLAVWKVGVFYGDWMRDTWNLILWLRQNGYHVVLLNRVVPEKSNFEIAWNKFWADKI